MENVISQEETPEGFVAVSSYENSCAGCYYYYNMSCTDITPCLPAQREDRQDVIFIKRDQQMNKSDLLKKLDDLNAQAEELRKLIEEAIKRIEAILG